MVEDSVKALLQALASIGPASNRLVQMFFMLPKRAIALYKMYPEVFEREEEIKSSFRFEYTSDGTIRPSEGLCYHLNRIFLCLFRLLANEDTRKQLLGLAGLNEEQFREFDPLRMWLDVALDYVADVDKEALRLLDILVAKLAGKPPSEAIDLGSDEWKKAVKDIKNADECLKLLVESRLLFQKYSSHIYVRECPLLLEAYSDLREKLKGLLK